MGYSAVVATIVFAVFAFVFIGVLLAISFVIDRRRVRRVKESIPERVETARDMQRRIRESAPPPHIEVHRADESGRGEPGDRAG